MDENVYARLAILIQHTHEQMRLLHFIIVVVIVMYLVNTICATLFVWYNNIIRTLKI